MERARRRWRLHQQFVTRPAISRALDRYCLEVDPYPSDAAPGCVRLHDGPCDYWGRCTGMNLGTPERRAAGLELLEQGWAA